MGDDVLRAMSGRSEAPLAATREPDIFSLECDVVSTSLNIVDDGVMSNGGAHSLLVDSLIPLLATLVHLSGTLQSTRLAYVPRACTLLSAFIL